MVIHEIQNWQTEKNLAHIYRILSDLESGNPRQLLFLELAKDADEQADLWAKEVRKAREMPPVNYRPDRRTRAVAWLLRWLGPRPILPLLTVMKFRGLGVYGADEPGSTPAPSDPTQDGHKTPARSYSAEVRQTVLSINDGLVAMFLLMLAVAGATTDSNSILLTGVAGLLAGAIAMAAGEALSARPARQAATYFEPNGHYPAAETRELALIYQRRGMSAEAADAQARRMIDDPELGLDLLAREAPRRIRPATMSPTQASTRSFFAFLFGGTIPLLPYLLEIKRHPLLLAVTLGCVALVASGGATSRISGRRATWGGLRLLALAGTAGVACYAIGGWLATKIGQQVL